MTDLLVSFAAAGGAPPASQELVRVFRDGRVRALAGTASPGLGRVDEAGAYAFKVDADALAELERLAEAAAGEELDGPREPGSGGSRSTSAIPRGCAGSVRRSRRSQSRYWPTACARCWSRPTSTRSRPCGWSWRRRGKTRSA